MPWSREDGAALAQQIMDGNYSPRLFSIESDKKARLMLELVTSGDDTPSSLQRSLKQFSDLLDDHGRYTDHLHRARLSIQNLCVMLEGVTEIPWRALRKTATPKYIREPLESDFNIEGITVWRESKNPWRKVKHLIVLGFSEGNYPSKMNLSCVFSADDIKNIEINCGIKMVSGEAVLNTRRELFKQQLSFVSNFVTFLIPRLSSNGGPLSPSDSTVFISPLFGGIENSILEIDIEEHREKIQYLARANELDAITPRVIDAADLQLERNLLEVRKDKDGNSKPESPSGLEKMMVSPLAWLLSRLGIESKSWSPEEFDVLIQGTLAHFVFEKLFAPDSSLPTEKMILDDSQSILDDGILKFAPYLRGQQWKIERENLLNGVVKAALAWRNTLDSLDATVLGCEQWLKGKFSGIAIHGQADAIVRLDDGQILVVDYKRSSSTARQPRMAAGYDSQAYLYIAMLNSKGELSEENPQLFKHLKTSSKPGIVYYMLNDQTALADYSSESTKNLPGWEFVADDVSSSAVSLIRERLKEIESGMIELNRNGDADFYEKKTGIKPYALADSPLISIFMLEDEEEVVE
jgi:hypothetical protein